jgi:hypothetical protein
MDWQDMLMKLKHPFCRVDIMRKAVFIAVLCFFLKTSFSQNTADYSNTKKGRVYILWGWNRAAYTKSNISFSGSDYDFTLKKVMAHDRPSSFSYHNYFQMDRLTIPQTNFRVGYFIKRDIAVSFGFDHMKYVMTQDQTVFMTGVIEQEGSFKGNYSGDKKLTSDFLTFEHTDGLNYINVEGEKYFNLYHDDASNKLMIAGVLMPRTDVKLLNYERNDQFHIAGFGVSGKAGIQATFFKHLVIKLENKYGYINMPDILLHKKGIPGTAKQAFFFAAVDGMIGGSFTFRHKRRNDNNREW